MKNTITLLLLFISLIVNAQGNVSDKIFLESPSASDGLDFVLGLNASGEVTESVFPINQIQANTNKVGITPSQASEIAVNTLKRSYPLVDENKLGGIETGATADQIASEVPIVDTGNIFASTNVEGSLMELAMLVTGLAHTTIDNINLMPIGGTNEFTIQVEWTDGDGVSHITTDPTPITVDSSNFTTLDTNQTITGDKIFASDIETTGVQITSLTDEYFVTAGGGARRIPLITDISEFTGTTLTGDFRTLTIPEGFTIIGGNSYRDKLLERVIFPNSISVIGAAAFRNNNLTDVVIPPNITLIDVDVFRENDLTSLSIPNNITSIGSSAFRENSLTSLIIPDNVTSIGAFAFSFNQLSSLTLPNNITILNSYAFRNNNLTNVIIPNSVTTIGSNCFSFNQLTSLSIPNNVTTIGVSAFINNNLTSLIIPDNVTSIGAAAFSNNNISNINIGSGITSIGDTVFRNNNLSGSVIIPDNVTSIGNAAFSLNPLMTELSVLTGTTLGTDVVDAGVTITFR